MASLETWLPFWLFFGGGFVAMYLLLDLSGILAAHDAYEREQERQKKRA